MYNKVVKITGIQIGSSPVTNGYLRWATKLFGENAVDHTASIQQKCYLGYQL